MRIHVRVARPQRQPRTFQIVARPVAAAHTVARVGTPVPVRTAPKQRIERPDIDPIMVDPYQDYDRVLTAESGIRITFKDLDLRLRHTLWRLFVWTIATGVEAWYLLELEPLQPHWIAWLCLAIVAVVNWLIVRKPVEVYRDIEVRPDCLIIEGVDLFWRRFMENGWPSFSQDEEENFVLSGVYGTRFVEYLTVRRFDELDRAPEVFAAHLQDAMQQLWTKLY